MKIIDDLFNTKNKKIKILVNTISYCTFLYLLIGTSISNAEVEHDSIIAGTTTQFYSSNNTDDGTLPPEMIRIFVDKNHINSIVVGKQDCSIMRVKTNTYGFGFKIGGLLYGLGPEVYYGHSSGINWNWGAQLMVAEFQELCTRFNTGRLSHEEYSEEVYGIINRSRKYTEELEKRFKKKKDALFKEIEEQ
tara:strand:+ start:278 stop:850 length:573 start_codon:yes stop_codon:yes gene_type:complete